MLHVLDDLYEVKDVHGGRVRKEANQELIPRKYQFCIV